MLSVTMTLQLDNYTISQSVLSHQLQMRDKKERWFMGGSLVGVLIALCIIFKSNEMKTQVQSKVTDYGT